MSKRINNYNTVSTSPSIQISNTNTIGNIFTTGGNVGINTTSPASKLHILETTATGGNPADIYINKLNERSAIQVWGYANSRSNLLIGSNAYLSNFGNLIMGHTGGNAAGWYMIMGSQEDGFRLSRATATNTAVDYFSMASSGSTLLSILPNLDQPNNIRIGRLDLPTIRYHDLEFQSSVSQSSSYMAIKLHNGTTTTSQTEVMRLRADGNVGINTTSPAFNLDVNGTSRITGSLTTGSLFSTNLTTSNAVFSNVSASTLRGTDLFLSGTLTTVNITTQNILVSTGTLIANSSTLGSLLISTGNLNILGGNIIASGITTGNLVVNGTTRIIATTGSTVIFQNSVNYGSVLEINSTATNGRNFKIQSTASADGLNSEGAFVIDDATSSLRRFVIGSSGNVGINTATPSFRLDVNGTSRITSSGSGQSNGTLLLTGSDFYGHTLYIAGSSNTNKRLGFNHNGSVGNIWAYDYSGSVIQNLCLQFPGGNVGISTTAPSTTLDVNGTFRATSSAVNGFTFTDGTTRLDISSGRRGASTAAGWTNLDPNGGTSGSTGLYIYDGLHLDSASTTTLGSTFITSTLNVTGNVGINTTSPGETLSVNGPIRTIGGTGILNFWNAAQSTRFGYLYHNGANGPIELNNQQASDIVFSTNNSEKMRIGSSGNVSINSADSQGYKLLVNGGFRVNGEISVNGGIYLNRVDCSDIIVRGNLKPQLKYSIISSQGGANLEATDFNLRFRMNSQIWQVATISGTVALNGGTRRFYGGVNSSAVNQNYTATTTFQDITTSSGSSGDIFIYTFTYNTTTAAYKFTGMTNNGFGNNIMIVEKLV